MKLNNSPYLASLKRKKHGEGQRKEQIESRTEVRVSQVRGEASQPKQSVECKMKVRKEVRDHLWTTTQAATRCRESAAVEAQQLGYEELTIRGQKSYSIVRTSV